METTGIVSYKSELKKSQNDDIYLTIKVDDYWINIFQDCKKFLDVANDENLVGKTVQLKKIKQTSKGRKQWNSMGSKSSFKYVKNSSASFFKKDQ